MDIHILFLSRWQPFPPNNGSKQRIYNLIKLLCARYTVSLITFMEPGETTPPAQPVIPNLKSVQAIVRKPFTPTSWRARLGFFNLKPRFVIDTYSHEMEAAIQTAIQKENINLVIASQFDMAIYWPEFREIPAIFEEMEIGIFKQRIQEAGSRVQKLRDNLTWIKHRRYMSELLNFYELGTVVSSQEAELAHQAFPEARQIVVLPNCVNLNDYQGFDLAPDPHQLIFAGSFSYEPNYQAMLWFVEYVFPQVLDTHPATRLVITGDPAGKEFPLHPNITQTGMLADVRPWIAGSWISLAPLLVGGGTRLKILEAIGLRSVVVSTRKGAEGLQLSSGEHLMIADQPTDFASAVKCLLDDALLRDRLVSNAYQRVVEMYDWGGQAEKIYRIIDQIALN